MRCLRPALLAPLLLFPAVAAAQSGYIAPDGRNRYPGVTIFCPNGTGVTPCSFGGGGGGAVTINLGGSAVGAGNPFPVNDGALDALIGGGALHVSGTFWPATQPVSAASLPLPTGAATDADLTAPQAPVAPATATAGKSLLIGCLANTTLPSFAAGQEGAVPCDTSGRPYVVTVPSANNMPAYLQAVTSGGATGFSAANAAASCMATNIKTSAGMVFSYSVSNSNSGGVWFRMFASGTAPTCGSGTPTKRVFVAGGSTVALSTALGWVFASGIGYDITAGSGADSDTTNVTAANSVLVDIDYK